MEENQEYLLDDGFEFEKPVRYVGFWMRFAGSLIDSLVLAPLSILVFFSIVSFKSFIFTVVLLVIAALYKPLMEHYYGATVGKMALSVKVVNASFQKMDLGQSFLRSSPWLVQSAVSIVSMYFMFYTIGFNDVEEFLEFAEFQQRVNDPTTIISYMISSFLLISGIVIATNDYAQGLHDKMANTFVIYK